MREGERSRRRRSNIKTGVVAFIAGAVAVALLK